MVLPNQVLDPCDTCPLSPSGHMWPSGHLLKECVSLFCHRIWALFQTGMCCSSSENYSIQRICVAPREQQQLRNPHWFWVTFNMSQPNRHDGDFGMSLKCLRSIGQTALPPFRAGRGVPRKSPLIRSSRFLGGEPPTTFLSTIVPRWGIVWWGSGL